MIYSKIVQALLCFLCVDCFGHGGDWRSEFKVAKLNSIQEKGFNSLMIEDLHGNVE